MPTDPFLPEGRQFPRTRSPEGGRESERKRRRKVLSCYDCRRRKLQCDRILPACGRCTKAGQASNCLYLEDAADAPARDPIVDTPSSIGSKLPPFYGHSSRPIGATAPSGDLLSRLEYQDGRIKQLEAALAGASGRSGKVGFPLSPESIAGGETFAPVQERETTLLRGRSFKTQFHGKTHPGALIARIPELQGFTRETFEQFPALARIKEDMSSLEDRMEYAGSKHEAISDDQLRGMLPPKLDTDLLMKVYLDSYGTIYNVLHLPSFRTEYTEMWDKGTSNTDPRFVALVITMMAAAQCLTTESRIQYRANSSTTREKAVSWIAAVDSWLLPQTQKHVAAVDFQIRVVLLVAKQVVARKFKRTWTERGSVLRFCMAAGLHRTPELIRKPTSVLDKELRKRIWSAVTELELQASFDRGMISAPWALQSDCPGPMHIHDDDIDQETPHLPALRRMNDFTSNSFLCLASESHQLRATLNTYLNNIRQIVSFEEAKHYTEEIEAHLSAIPAWTVDGSELSKALLSLNLRQYMLVLHDRQMRRAESRAERDFSRMILVDTARRMITAHQSLVNQGIYALELFCHDPLRAALSLCHLNSIANPHADDALSQVIETAATELVPQAIEMLTDKVMRFGRENAQLWILLAASGYMKSKRDPSKKMSSMQEVVDKITRPYYRIMACQEDAPPTPAADSNSTNASQAKDASTGVVEYFSSTADDSGAGTFPPIDSTSILDLDEFAAWTFEDWSFNPIDLNAMSVPFQRSYDDDGMAA